MKIMLINGSPKRKKSSSGILAKALKQFLKDNFVSEYHVPDKKTAIPDDWCDQDAIVFLFPLYVDELPAHLLQFLAQLETKLPKHPIAVYAVVNCGFYEGKQNKWALKMMENWCLRSGAKWGGGIGVGGGGMVPAMGDLTREKGFGKDICCALKNLAQSILKKQLCQIQFVSPNFPRCLYIMMAQRGWRKQIKQNGMKVAELNRRL